MILKRFYDENLAQASYLVACEKSKKAAVVDPTSVEDELVREAAFSCPTQAIEIEDIEEFLPWQLRGKSAPRRVQRTFMFTDIVKSTNLVEALGDEAWQAVRFVYRTADRPRQV